MCNCPEILTPVTLLIWSIALIFSVGKNVMIGKIKDVMIITGIVVLGIFIISLWIRLQRPPLKTLGETRMWYSFFLSATGFIVYKKWKYAWFAAYSIFLSMIFLLINYLNPETYSKTLIPALQSIWFIPHVIVYLLAYALLGASSVAGFKCIYDMRRNRQFENNLLLADDMVYIGFGFLTMGLVFGALWAKQAWGHYWTWDPKETWAFITWAAYLAYIHHRYNKPALHKTHAVILALAFVILLICWLGINYLPSAQSSVHVY